MSRCSTEAGSTATRLSPSSDRRAARTSAATWGLPPATATVRIEKSDDSRATVYRSAPAAASAVAHRSERADGRPRCGRPMAGTRGAGRRSAETRTRGSATRWSTRAPSPPRAALLLSVERRNRDRADELHLGLEADAELLDRKSTRLNSSHANISYA